MTCPCKQSAQDGVKFCDQCGATLPEHEVVRPTLVRPALYKCGRCGVELLNVEGTTFCDHCGLKFRLMTQCPSGHSLHDLAASFCSECGERIATERFPPLRLAPVERFNVIRSPAPTAVAPQVSLSHGGIASKLSDVYGSIRRHIQKPKVRIIRNTETQARARVMYPQTLQQQIYPQMQPQVMPPQMYPQTYPPMQQQMYPQMQPQIMQPNFMYPNQGNMRQRPPTIYPLGFHPPNRIVHPQGGQRQRWPFGAWGNGGH